MARHCSGSLTQASGGIMAFNRRSKNITQGVARSPNRSMYYAMGYEKADFD